jgi:hypothetical protein
MTLAPTHHCFDDALDYLSALIIRKEITIDDREHRLVHALCKAPGGEVFAHGWVEKGGEVISAFMIEGLQTYLIVSQDKFYGWFQPFDFVKYTVREAAQKNLTTFSYGPWEPRIKAACGEGKILGVAGGITT